MEIGKSGEGVAYIVEMIQTAKTMSNMMKLQSKYVIILILSFWSCNNLDKCPKASKIELLKSDIWEKFGIDSEITCNNDTLEIVMIDDLMINDSLTLYCPSHKLKYIIHDIAYLSVSALQDTFFIKWEIHKKINDSIKFCASLNIRKSETKESFYFIKENSLLRNFIDHIYTLDPRDLTFYDSYIKIILKDMTGVEHDISFDSFIVSFSEYCLGRDNIIVKDILTELYNTVRTDSLLLTVFDPNDLKFFLDNCDR